jgi:hypothetical protein
MASLFSALVGPFVFSPGEFPLGHSAFSTDASPFHTAAEVGVRMSADGPWIDMGQRTAERNNFVSLFLVAGPPVQRLSTDVSTSLAASKAAGDKCREWEREEE